MAWAARGLQNGGPRGDLEPDTWLHQIWLDETRGGVGAAEQGDEADEAW